jgi:hypothetical protein
MTGLLCITSSSADNKLINSFLLHIRHWEYEGGDQFALITTSNKPDLEPLPSKASNRHPDLSSPSPTSFGPTAPYKR